MDTYKTMEQADNAINIGDVLDELGVTLPTTDEQQTAESSEESTVSDTEEIDTTNTDNNESETSTDDENQSSDDDESTDDDSADAEDESDPDARSVKKLSKRVDKLTARAKTAEEQAAALQTELAATKEQLAKAQPVIVADAADPLANIENLEQLEERLAVAKKVRKWALANLEGASVSNSAGEETYYEPAQVREFLANADELITEHAPKKREFIQAKSVFLQEAKAVYPELFKEGSQLRQVMQETLRQYPALAKMPNLEIIIGDAMRGQAARFAELEARSKSAKTKQPATAVVAPKVVNPSAAPRAKSKPNALEALKKTGSREAAESFVAGLLDD